MNGSSAAFYFWTSDDDRTALNARANRDSYDVIGARLGRTGYAVKQRLGTLGGRTPEKAARVLGIETAPDSPVAPRFMAHANLDKVHPRVLERRAALAEARDRQPQTSALLGDPPPGYSALDLRQAGSGVQ